MNKEKTLSKTEAEIARCKQCKKGKAGKPVPGEGNLNAKVVFVGEAPGPQESRTGSPFVGRSGRFLDSLFLSVGIDRNSVFITSPVKYYPGRRAPTGREIEHGKTHLLKEIETIRPRLIVLLGNVAHRALLRDARVSATHGQTTKKNGLVLFSTFHPSAAARFPKIRGLMVSDFKKLQKVIRRL